MADASNPAVTLRGLEAEFELVRELGRGGSAVVYLAIERELGREVAIKTVHPVFAMDPDAAARLVREARTLARLQHPNIVTFYGVRRLADGGLAMVMQYVRGERLKDRIRSVGPLPVEEARRILLDVARALVHAHRHHVVHRDIKPENIYLDADVGLARLSDFGIARPLDQDASLTQAGLAIGTPAYMAPEQIDGGVLDARSDIYALGLVAHEMLSGRRPWEGQNLYGIIYRQKNEALPRLADLRPDVPREMAAAIETALAKQPDQRWPDAEAFLDAIADTPGSGTRKEEVTAPPRVSRVPPLPELEALPGDWEEDAPTIPYRPAEVAAPGERQAPPEDEPAIPAASARSQPGGEDHAALLAEAERALGEWEAAAPPPRLRLRLGRRHLAIAAGLVAVVAGGLGAVSLVRAHNARARAALAWASYPSTSPRPPAASQNPRAAAPELVAAAATSPPATAAEGVSASRQSPSVERAGLARPSASVAGAGFRRQSASTEKAAFRRQSASTEKAALRRQLARRERETASQQRAAHVASATPPESAPARVESDSVVPPRLAPTGAGSPRLIGARVDVAADSHKAVIAVPTQAAAPAPAAPAQLKDIESEPVFTPFTVAPELKNRAEVAAALSREYPRLQKLGNPRGHVLVWLLLDEAGVVRKTQLKESSGSSALDQAALQLGTRMRFSPALERDRRVPIWVSVPVDFVSR